MVQVLVQVMVFAEKDMMVAVVVALVQVLVLVSLHCLEEANILHRACQTAAVEL